MNKNNAILVSEGIHKSYRMGATEVRVLKGVNLAVQRGEFVAIVGASGSGKSTLLHILGALDKPDKGIVRVEKQDLNRFNSGELNRFRNKMVGFVFQFFALMVRSTALQNVELSLAISEVDGSERRKRAKELLDMVGLRDRAGHRPGELSGGEQQRVAIARALANDPTFVLLDEPTGNLNSKEGAEIMEMFKELNNNGTTIIQVTHSEKNAYYGRRIIHLLDGWIQK